MCYQGFGVDQGFDERKMSVISTGNSSLFTLPLFLSRSEYAGQ